MNVRYDLPEVVISAIYYPSTKRNFAPIAHPHYWYATSLVEKAYFKKEYMRDTYGDFESNNRTREFLKNKGILPSKLPSGTENHYLIALAEAFKKSDYWLNESNFNGRAFFQRDPLEYLTPEHIQKANLNFFVDVRQGIDTAYSNSDYRELEQCHDSSRILEPAKKSDSVGFYVFPELNKTSTEKFCYLLLAIDTKKDINGAKYIVGSTDVKTISGLTPEIIEHIKFVREQMNGFCNGFCIEDCLEWHEYYDFPFPTRNYSIMQVLQLLNCLSEKCNYSNRKAYAERLLSLMDPSLSNMICSTEYLKSNKLWNKEPLLDFIKEQLEQKYKQAIQEASRTGTVSQQVAAVQNYIQQQNSISRECGWLDGCNQACDTCR